MTQKGRAGGGAAVVLAKDKEQQEDEKSFLQKAMKHDLPLADWQFQRRSLH